MYPLAIEGKHTKEKLHLAFYFMKEALYHVKSESDVKALLLPSIMNTFIKILINSELALYDAALDVVSFFLKFSN